MGEGSRDRKRTRKARRVLDALDRMDKGGPVAPIIGVEQLAALQKEWERKVTPYPPGHSVIFDSFTSNTIVDPIGPCTVITAEAPSPDGRRACAATTISHDALRQAFNPDVMIAQAAFQAARKVEEFVLQEATR